MSVASDRLESRLRFNKLLSWNTFPLPNLSGNQRSAIVAAGERVLAARKRLGDVSLADMYPPSGVDEALQHAHDELDRHVDQAFGMTAPQSSSYLARQDVLFARYVEMTSDLLAPASVQRRRSRG